MLKTIMRITVPNSMSHFPRCKSRVSVAPGLNAKQLSSAAKFAPVTKLASGLANEATVLAFELLQSRPFILVERTRWIFLRIFASNAK